MRTVCLVFAASFALSLSGFTKTIHVPADFSKIQDAIDAAADGDLILVSPGRYVENIKFKGKAITLRSTGGCDATILDGNRSGPVVTFQDKEPPEAVLCGFTITNGYNPTAWGGGIYITDFSAPTIEHNRIVRNEAKAGGGIFAMGCDSLIEHNVVEYNTATLHTGGIHLTSLKRAVVRDNIIRYNRSLTFGGGGLSVNTGSEVDVINNVIAHNCSNVHCGGISWIDPEQQRGALIGNRISDNFALGSGGGVIFEAGLHVIRDNIITNNTARSSFGGMAVISFDFGWTHYIINNLIAGNRCDFLAGGIGLAFDTHYFINNTVSENFATDEAGGILIQPWTEVIIRNCIVWGNHARIEDDEIQWWTYPDIQYSDIRGGWPGPGNIDKDPRFVDPENGDFHLRRDSPCIDAGTLDTRFLPHDFEGDPRVSGSGIDMGADEFHTHLYFIGEPSPGASICLKIIGPPDAAPVMLFASEGLLDPPMPTNFGPWFLSFPVFGPYRLPAIPGKGVLEVYAVMPPDITAPWTLNFQAFVVDTFTNLSALAIAR